MFLQIHRLCRNRRTAQTIGAKLKELFDGAPDELQMMLSDMGIEDEAVDMSAPSSGHLPLDQGGLRAIANTSPGVGASAVSTASSASPNVAASTPPPVMSVASPHMNPAIVHTAVTLLH